MPSSKGLLKEQEFRGYWWLPNNPDEKVGGIATYSPEQGVYLELFSMLQNDPEYMGSDKMYKTEYIHGITTEGEKITLRDCARDKYSISGGEAGIGNATYLAISLLEGGHFSNDVEFDRLRLHYPLLEEWAGISGVSLGDLSALGGKVSAGDSFNINYEFPESPQADLGNFDLKVVCNTSMNTGRVGGLTLDEDVYFEIIANEGKISLDSLFDYSKKLQDFMILATGKDVPIARIIGRIEQSQTGIDDIEVYTGPVEDPSVPNQLHPNRANFILADIIEHFSNTMKKWFDKYSELEEVYNLYFATRYNSKMYGQEKFLYLTRAIESYHRNVKGGQYLPEDDFEDYYEQLCENIPEQFDEDFRQHLKHGTFKYANEYSLRKRLDEVISEFETVMERLPWEADMVVSKVIETRNYLVHYDEQLQHRSDTMDIYDQSLLLRAILESALLHHLGISEEQIIERIGNRYDMLTRGSN